MIEVRECPICRSTNLSQVFQCKDYTTTQEIFNLMKCNQCDLHLTSPRPENEFLGKYYQSDAYVSHTKESRSLIDTVYRISRRFTLKWKINIVKQYAHQPENISLLDYGCGTGAFLKSCNEEGIRIQGVEPSSQARKIAEDETGIKIAQTIIETSDNQDIITLWHVLEHIPDYDNIIQQLKSKMNPNGALVIAVPNHESWDAVHYKRFWAGYDVPRHLWHFSKKNVHEICKKHDLIVTSIIPMKLDAFYVSLLSEKYKTGSMGLKTILNAFLTGLRSNLKGKQKNNYSSLIYVIKKK